MTRRAYVLCATPRSGSTLLCSLLHSSGVAGHPESWFRLPNRPEFAADWGICAPDGSFDWSTYLAAAIKADHDAWQAWFAVNLITPCRLTCESLSADPQSTALSVLAHRGLTAPQGVRACNVKMADALSMEWAARFRAQIQG